MSLVDGLNPPQAEGVLTTEGPVLILAGAGSGKTRVLTHRVAYLIEKGVAPYNIMAITFTNKAAAEMRSRINNMVGGGEAVWVATFHSSCVRILRRFAERIGYESSFTIYDSDDSKTLMKEVFKYLNYDPKQMKEKAVLNAISNAKNELIDDISYANSVYGDFNKQKIAAAYREYQARLRANNAMDFDDLIMNTVQLFKQDSEALRYYQDRLHYIMVDEYQDTNTAQFEMVRLLASAHENLCVVGDDDQSIYKFRGANIYNILNFEEHFPGAKVIRLEQNYRSTGNILAAANGVIANNEGRKRKTLWTSEEAGEKILFKQFDSAYEEAAYIARDIASGARKAQFAYNDCAVLYRTNAQSRMIEEKLIYEGIPYKLVGGVNFYSRKEIKDLIAYLKTIDNGYDDIAVTRIINVPKRGIGQTTIDKVMEFAYGNNMSFYAALEIHDEIASIKGSVGKKLEPFVELISDLRDMKESSSVSELLQEVIDVTGYVDELKLEGTDEAKSRIENIEELMNKCITYEHEAEEPSLSGFLEEVALVADIDSMDNEENNYVVLMTLHGAKGLEFPRVYMAGMEDGLFPSQNAIFDERGSDSELEEERRLCYVGITRAKEQLIMTSAKMRMIRGETQFSKISRFVKEIPSELIEGNLYEEQARDPFASGADSTGGGVPYGIGRYDSFGGGVSSSGIGGFGGRPVGAVGSSGFNFGVGGGSSSGSQTRFSSGSSGVGSKFGTGVSSGVKSYSDRVKAAKNDPKVAGSHIVKQELDYGVGDRVSHIKFKEGTVTEIFEGERDYEVTVEFDEFGVKKMFASFAKLVKKV